METRSHSITGNEGPSVTRRGFVKAGGALFVSLSISSRVSAVTAAENKNSLDATHLASWLEIRSDNTIVARTGRAEIGTGMSAFYAQMIAEELNVHPDSITLIMGDTDRTPDGGYSAGFLNGANNVRKVAAYTYQALLKLASTQLGVPVSDLTVTNGVVSGNSKTISYGQLVTGQHLDLTIPVTGKPMRFVPPGTNSVAGLDWGGMDGLMVTGDPPLKPVSQFQYIGKSHPIPGIPGKVMGTTEWSCDVTLSGMLHARMIRPATFGSALISAGTIDKKRFPGAEVIIKANLVAVVSPDEWEAVSAAQSVAAATKWTAWSGLPGSENLTRAIREYKWGAPDESRGNAADVAAALSHAGKTLSATYEQPYVKHAPIGPFVAVADVRSDGAVTVWTHSSHSQALRARIANALNISSDKVIVRWLEHAGQFGRTTLGGDGAELDAVILSQLTGKPVRVQWTLQEDLQWSTAAPGWVADMKAALAADGRIAAIHTTFYSPHMFDVRPLGAILAGMPAGTTKPGAFLAVEWPYDKISNRLEQASGMPNIGDNPAVGGLRGNIMRTPGQRQQNFALESLISEAAAESKSDPIEYRLRHTTEQRLVDIIHATSQAAAWESRPSPHPNARRTGNDPVTGRGMAIMQRTNGYWVGIAELSVIPATGIVKVNKFTLGVECGKIINPRQLDRCMKGGLVMGLSEALKEEVLFDREKVTSTDWSTYKILTMEEMPDIKVVQISRNDKGFGAGGEAPNALAPPAVAAAFFDATGVHARRIPLTPAYVKKLLEA